MFQTFSVIEIFRFRKISTYVLYVLFLSRLFYKFICFLFNIYYYYFYYYLRINLFCIRRFYIHSTKPVNH